MLTEAQITRQPKNKYMSQEQLEFFEHRLTKMKAETIAHIESVRAELVEAQREADVIDRAALEDDRALKLRIVDREMKLLRKIDLAIARIHDGTYGFCEETGEEIGIKRLLLRPTATLSAESKKFAEEIERRYEDDDHR